MYDRTRNLVLRWLKVPPEPHPPFGDPASLRVFRAGRNYFKLRLIGWGFAQAAALAGIIFWAVVLIEVEDAARAQKLARASQPATPPANMAETIKSVSADLADQSPKRKPRIRRGWAGFQQLLVEVALRLPPWAFPVIWLLKLSGFALYLGQIPFTYALMRLDYEMRWYVVTDRSLRIRTGVWNVQELTMSFANLQQVVVTQGPVQRLLGLSDLRVQSAGGGNGEQEHKRHEQSLHTGHFHGVDNATEIRDLILERLRRFRESGLGDPDETHRPHPATAGAGRPAETAGPELVAAAHELRDEARALRALLG